MAKYIAKRIGYAVLTVFFLTALTFFMLRMLPGDPFIGEKAISPVTMAALKVKYGLDKPVAQQFLIYMGNIAKGDLGISINYNRPVPALL